MDLSRLARPAILCQCARCSSSLAALENEWAKLSNSYAIAAGWLSVELHRISISSEKKQIPQSSDLSLIRGRIIQEIACRLCQQKLGVLCALDSGPNIFWKMSKVSFRGIVTMRTVEPSFKDGLIESLIFPTAKEPSVRPDGTPIQPGALVRTSSHEINNSNPSVEQQIQHHGLSLDHISSSVSNLHDTMFELKQAFTTLRIELNNPNRIPNEIGNMTGGEFNMLTTVLKELKLKSDEMEKLKLEIEALKLRNRVMEEQAAKQTLLPPMHPEALPEVRTPGLLQGSRKRPFPDYFQSGRNEPIADSFDDDDEDSMADLSLEDAIVPPIKVPLRDSIDDSAHELTSSKSSRPQNEVGQPALNSSLGDYRETNMNIHRQTITKRRRLSHSADRPPSSGNSDFEKKRPGRPRKSTSNAINPDLSQTPKPKPLSVQNGNSGSNSQPPSANTTPTETRNSREARPTHSRTLRSRSKPPSLNSRIKTGAADTDNDMPVQDETQFAGSNRQDHPSRPNTVLDSTENTDSGKENPPLAMNSGNKSDVDEKRKAQTAARDIMAKLAMQREEAMDTEESR
ncbi:hypothetical protein ARAM_006562 [Aspergillus rambellii]|uniref:Mis18 domain-containing protein n=1 Tax=Aspergillus rambellii TaxID=308745 RepID=A0A0F8VI22_9EURO|nr:hypothetical protein ARAM_006562 [Aspergillus rambellii]